MSEIILGILTLQDSNRFLYALWTDEEFGYVLIHVDKRNNKYDLQPKTDKVIPLLNNLPDYKR